MCVFFFSALIIFEAKLKDIAGQEGKKTGENEEKKKDKMMNLTLLESSQEMLSFRFAKKRLSDWRKFAQNHLS